MDTSDPKPDEAPGTPEKRRLDRKRKIGGNNEADTSASLHGVITEGDSGFSAAPGMISNVVDPREGVSQPIEECCYFPRKIN